MRLSSIKYILTTALITLLSCGQGESFSVKKYSGVVINEVAAHDEIEDADSWVEIVNTSTSSIDLSDLSLYLFDSYFEGLQLHSFEGESLEAGQRMVLSTADGSLKTGFASDAHFELKISNKAKGASVDSFILNQQENQRKLSRMGSYQRIPDGTGEWKHSIVGSKNAENTIHTLQNTKPNGIWVWSTHMEEWIANDGAVMRNMKALGYDHALLNFAAFRPANAAKAHRFIELAAEVGMVVHAWLQCFSSGSTWTSPVDDANNCYNQGLFDNLIASANSYIDEFGVEGIHLDYVRFPGTAYKHNPSKEVTAEGAVNEFCAQMRKAMDDRGEKIIISAALMAEDNGIYYYGQNAAKMGNYVDVLMPMSYRYAEKNVTYNEEWCKKAIRLFTSITQTPVWAGTSTYNYPEGSSVKGLSAETIRTDCEIFANTAATGVVLFRYGLGEFPDVNDLWDNK